MSESAEFSKIVIAFDGSDDSVKAVRLAGSVASKYASTVTLVHVVKTPLVDMSAAAGMPMPDYSVLERAAKTAGENVLAKGLSLAAEMGLKAKGELVDAPSVVEAIVNFAEKEGADLVVVGTRGMTGFKQLILGSVSSGLVSHAKCPVLVAR